MAAIAPGSNLPAARLALPVSLFQPGGSVVAWRRSARPWLGVLPQAWFTRTLPEADRALVDFSLLDDGRVYLNVGNRGIGAALKDEVRSKVRIRFSSGNRSVAATGIGDATDPFEWRPSNAAEWAALTRRLISRRRGRAAVLAFSFPGAPPLALAADLPAARTRLHAAPIAAVPQRLEVAADLPQARLVPPPAPTVLPPDVIERPGSGVAADLPAGRFVQSLTTAGWINRARPWLAVLPQAWFTRPLPDSGRALVDVTLITNGRVWLDVADGASPALRDDIRRAMRIRFSFGDLFIETTGIGDATDPFEWRPSNGDAWAAAARAVIGAFGGAARIELSVPGAPDFAVTADLPAPRTRLFAAPLAAVPQRLDIAASLPDARLAPPAALDPDVIRRGTGLPGARVALPAARFDRSTNVAAWRRLDDTGLATLPQAWFSRELPEADRALVDVSLVSDGRIYLNVSNRGIGGAVRAEVRRAIRIRFRSGDLDVEAAGIGDQNDPFEWRPSNAAEWAAATRALIAGGTGNAQLDFSFPGLAPLTVTAGLPGGRNPSLRHGPAGRRRATGDRRRPAPGPDRAAAAARDGCRGARRRHDPAGGAACPAAACRRTTAADARRGAAHRAARAACRRPSSRRNR